MISRARAPTNPTNMECGKYLENGNVIPLSLTRCVKREYMECNKRENRRKTPGAHV